MERTLPEPRLENPFPANPFDDGRRLPPRVPARSARADASTIALRAPDTAPLRMRLYRALAEALATAPGPAVIAFESGNGDRVPWVVVRPRALAEVIGAQPAFRHAGGSSGPIPRPAEPPTGFLERTAVLVPCWVRGPSRPPDGPIDRPVPETLQGPSAWVGVQTFWARSPTGAIWAARRLRIGAPSTAELRERFDVVAAGAALEWGRATGRPTSFVPGGIGSRRDWRRLATRSLPRSAWIALAPDRVGPTAEVDGPDPRPDGRVADGHAVVLGASGAGKTWFLAERAADAIGRGRPVVAIDLHGDLTPSIVARVDPGDRGRIVCVDLSDRPVPGIAAIAPTMSAERSAAHLVAALKRLSPDGTEVYWGFRLERIFDGFVRLAQETGGSLLDVHDLLTHPDRRDAARLATRSADLAQFLDELGPVVRRNPEFLWGATARLAKVAAMPELAELLAPTDGGLPVEELLSQGRSILVRAPFALLGPEAASFAGTLALGRIYLGQAARRTERPEEAPVLTVLDEVQGLSPRLVTEMLAEGRKFGFRLLVATQFPERLAPELRSAVAGVVREVVAFRVPLPSVSIVGGWLGLSRDEATRWLVDLPPGYGLAHDPERPGLRPVVPRRAVGPRSPEAWTDGVRATRTEFDPEGRDDTALTASDPAGERILLAILGADEERRPLSWEGVVPAAVRLPGPALDPARLSDRLVSLDHAGYVLVGDGGALHLTPAGERWLGLGAPTGASRETPAHRGLLLSAFRVFARRGHRLEILRQGRFDVRLPDARFHQLPESTRTGAPADLARALDRVRDGWAWRYFAGRDVNVEAEVSGALRAERIRHGVAKAAARDAFALFLVTDAKRAARVRAVLAALGARHDRAAVWVLAPGRPSVVPPPRTPLGDSAAPRGTGPCAPLTGAT